MTELDLPSFRFAADRDPLDERTMEAIAVGVSTRKYARSLEPLELEAKLTLGKILSIVARRVTSPTGFEPDA